LSNSERKIDFASAKQDAKQNFKNTMHETENSEACHPHTRLNSLEGNIPSSWAHLIMSGYFSLFKAVHNLHPKQILPGLLHRRTVTCLGLQTILEIACSQSVSFISSRCQVAQKLSSVLLFLILGQNYL